MLHDFSRIVHCGQNLLDLHATLGDGARLVQTQYVYSGQGLDTIEILRKSLMTTKPDNTDGKHGGRQRHQSLRNHTRHAADHAHDGLIQRVMLEQILFEE